MTAGVQGGGVVLLLVLLKIEVLKMEVMIGQKDSTE